MGTLHAFLLIFLLGPMLILAQNPKKPMLRDSFDLKKTKVWGPGLQPDKIVLPARYFFIEAAQFDGKPLGHQINKPFKVNITGKSISGNCHVRVEILDRKDGSFIVRYKMSHKCWDLSIEITHKGKHVAASPYKIKDPVYSEYCRCPQQIDQWLKNYKCNATFEQIDHDLKPFERLNFTRVRRKIMEKYKDHPQSISVCHYVIHSNRVFRQCFGQHVGFNMFSDNLLVSLARWVKLPDTEFFVNLGDYPLIRKGGIQRTHGPLPVFSWCGSEESFDIVLPTYDLTESSLEAMGRVTLDMMSVQNARLRWEDKDPVAFWRGRDSRRERLQLVDIAREYPDMFNASITNFFFYREEEVRYGPKVPHIGFFEFFDAKYQLNVDGTVAAYRLPYLLAGNSLVFKQDSTYYEHFYKQLTPWEHYVPFKSDLSDLVKRVEWAIHHDKTAEEISKKAQKFAEANLMPDHVFCYHVKMLKEWSKRLIEPVSLPNWTDMEQVEFKGDDSCDCEPWEEDHDEL